MKKRKMECDIALIDYDVSETLFETALDAEALLRGIQDETFTSLKDEALVVSLKPPRLNQLPSASLSESNVTYHTSSSTSSRDKNHDFNDELPKKKDCENDTNECDDVCADMITKNKDDDNDTLDSDAESKNDATSSCDDSLQISPQVEYNLRRSSIRNRVETDKREKHKQGKVPKSKIKAAPLSKYRRRTANSRERDRMQDMNLAYEELKSVIPRYNEGLAHGKITKITTLRLALNYIIALRRILGHNDDDFTDGASTSSAMGSDGDSVRSDSASEGMLSPSHSNIDSECEVHANS